MRTITSYLSVILLLQTKAFTTKFPNQSGWLALHAETLEGRSIEGELKPVNNFVLVKVAKEQEEIAGGIVLAKSAQIKKTEGLVVSKGPGKAHTESGLPYPIPVEPGESVLYGKYDGTEVEYNGEKHTLIRDDDILVKYAGSELSLETVETINDYVLVEVEMKEDETSGGVLLAASSDSNKRPSTGKVIKVGGGKMGTDGSFMAMDVKEGDMVKFRDFAGNEVSIESREFSVVRSADILAKF